jgi:hypothetical protein
VTGARSEVQCIQAPCSGRLRTSDAAPASERGGVLGSVSSIHSSAGGWTGLLGRKRDPNPATIDTAAIAALTAPPRSCQHRASGPQHPFHPRRPSWSFQQAGLCACRWKQTVDPLVHNGVAPLFGACRTTPRGLLSAPATTHSANGRPEVHCARVSVSARVLSSPTRFPARSLQHPSRGSTGPAHLAPSVLRSLAAVALQSLELHLRDPPHATAVGARHRSNRRGRKLPSIEFWNRIFTPWRALPCGREPPMPWYSVDDDPPGCLCGLVSTTRGPIGE